MGNRVVLFGRSLGIDSIAAALRASNALCAGAGLELLTAPLPSESAEAAVARILAFEPTAIVFDLVAGLPDGDLLRLLAQPHITLLGVDLATQRLLVLSGEQTPLSTTADLARALERIREACERPE